MPYTLAEFESDRADEMVVEEVIKLPQIEITEDDVMDDELYEREVIVD